MTRTAAVALSVALALSLTACDSGAEPKGISTNKPSPAPSPSPSVSPVINPPGIVVDNVAFGRSKKRLRRAIRDLKEVNLWLPLTKHLYKVKFASRLGVANIPEDGHLADAFLTADIDEEAQGRLCDVMFFPTAIYNDLARWRLYYSQGAIAEPPPTLRDYWAAIVAHELGHCFPGGTGEPAARKWEAKALARLQT